MNTQKNSKSTLIAAASGLVLCLALGSAVVATGSASENSNGQFLIHSVDTDEFEGYAGWTGEDETGAENPGGGDDGGTDPGTGNPTNPGNGGTDPGTNPGGGTDPQPEAPTDVPAVILACTANTNALKQFDGLTLRWSATRADQQTLTLSTGPSTGTVDTSKLAPVSQADKSYTFELRLTKAQTEQIMGNLLGSGFRIDVKSGKAPSVGRTLTMGAMGMNPTCTV